MNKSQQELVAQADLDVASGELQQELAWAEQELSAALEALYSPFSQLAQSQLRRSYPLLRAAIVLTAGVGDPDSQPLKAQRVHLAAALEMLQLALSIHTRLLTPTGMRQDIDQSVMGSTILAGDFCFSRAAGLAVQTHSPAVVDIFAQALQRMSEGRLRILFSPDQSFDEDDELFRSGILGAMALTGGNQDLQAALLRIGQQLALAGHDHARASFALLDSDLALCTRHQAARWQALAVWLKQVSV